jgi:ubiquinone/menaquinone biosynthesis C-methylase UbiE
MTNTDREKQTVDYYDRKAEAWASAHHGLGKASYWQGEMERFHELLPNGKVLEIGSGAGKDAETLIKMGYEYTGTDASEGLIKVAQKRNPKATFKQVGVYELNFPEHEFDGFWSAATLLHIPKDRIDEALQKIKTQVESGGIGFITMKAGAGEKEDPETGRWFAYYSKKGFQEVLERNGYQVIEERNRQGEKDWWLCFWVRAYR